MRKYIAPITVFVLTLGICGAGAVMFGPWVQEQRSIEACHGAGGQWDFAALTCAPAKSAARK